MKTPILFKNKTIISGLIIEQIEYGRSISHGFEISPLWKEKRKLARKVSKSNLSREQILEKILSNRRLSMLRAKKTLIRLVNSNVYQYTNTKGRPYIPTFLTLTFAKDIRNQKQANELFSLFIKRLNYHVHKNKAHPLKYSVVIEFQNLTREGVIHYHALLYDLPFIKANTLEGLWREGIINVTSMRSIKKIGTYLSKYMSKKFEDPRLDGHKRYFSSRGLIKPKTYAGAVAYTVIKNAIPKSTPQKKSEFISEKLGKVSTTIYTLENKGGISEFLNPEEIAKINLYDIS